MYESHFGFTKSPFRITPDPDFFFAGGNRGAVLEALVYAVSRGEGMVKVVGEVGSGKTMLCRMLEQELPASCEVVYLANPGLSADEILHAIAFELELEVQPGDTKLKALHALHAYLLERHAKNRRVIIFVEEAQGMPLESLEEIRMLSNLETTREKLLQIVLFGQPELDDKLNLHEIRQLRERITHSFKLAPFNRTEVRDYVNARVAASGYRGPTLFSAGAVRQIERYSDGLLRRINILADKALLAAFAGLSSTVGPDHVTRAAVDSEFARPRKPLWRWWLAGTLVITVVGLLWLRLQSQENVLPERAQRSELTPQSELPTKLDDAVAPPSASDSAADNTQPLIDPHERRGMNDNQALRPRISADSGLFTLEHLSVRPPMTAAESAPAR